MTAAAKHIANVTNMHLATINFMTAVAGGSNQKYFTATAPRSVDTEGVRVKG